MINRNHQTSKINPKQIPLCSANIPKNNKSIYTFAFHIRPIPWSNFYFYFLLRVFAFIYPFISCLLVTLFFFATKFVFSFRLARELIHFNSASASFVLCEYLRFRSGGLHVDIDIVSTLHTEWNEMNKSAINYKYSLICICVYLSSFGLNCSHTLHTTRLTKYYLNILIPDFVVKLKEMRDLHHVNINPWELNMLWSKYV